MHLGICKTCEHFKEVERYCICLRSKVYINQEIYRFGKHGKITPKSRSMLFQESRMNYSTFFRKDKPKECGEGKRNIEECRKCKDFVLSSRRFRCKNHVIYSEEEFLKVIPKDDCENREDHLSASGTE